MSDDFKRNFLEGFHDIDNLHEGALGIPGNGDGKIVPVQANLVIGQGGVGQLVNGVRGIGDNFPQENLLMGGN